MSENNIVKRACAQLGITQKELAGRLRVDDGTVRKWASGASKTPEWAEAFIALIIDNEHHKAISTKLEELIALLNTKPN